MMSLFCWHVARFLLDDLPSIILGFLLLGEQGTDAYVVPEALNYTNASNSTLISAAACRSARIATGLGSPPFTCATLLNGDAKCWGLNSHSNLGQVTTGTSAGAGGDNSTAMADLVPVFELVLALVLVLVLKLELCVCVPVHP